MAELEQEIVAVFIAASVARLGVIADFFSFDAPLFFANADYFRERVREFVAERETPTAWLLLDAEAIGTLDIEDLKAAGGASPSPPSSPRPRAASSRCWCGGSAGPCR